MDRGFVGAVKNTRNNEGDSNLSQQISELKSRFVIARVLDIVYDENSENWQELGQWNGVGSIKFEKVNFQTTKDRTRGIARPFFPNMKNFPLVNEIVYLMKLPSAESNQKPDAETFYYLPPVPVWNHPHHNAMPNPIQGEVLPESQKKDYQNIEGGSVRRVSDGSTEIDLNKGDNGTFNEKSDIHPLLPFAGDVILEGRFGNSIRLGNTSKTDSEYANIWSTNGSNGDPITIIRNGQPKETPEEGWLPITEDVNTDISSFTLTSTQKLPLEISNEDYSAFSSAPTSVADFVSNQAVLNSGRLVFNSKSDDVIISSAGNVAINAIKTMGLSADANMVLNSSDIKLGSKDADQALVLGDDFMVQFESLVQGVSNICDKLQQAKLWPGGSAVPDVPLIGVAVNTKATAQSILNNIKNGKLLSKVSKTK